MSHDKIAFQELFLLNQLSCCGLVSGVVPEGELQECVVSTIHGIIYAYMHAHNKNMRNKF